MIKSSHMSTILTCIGAVGVVITSVLAAKATPKAIKAIEEASDKKEDFEDLTKIEIFKAAAPLYLPAFVSGVATIGCLFGANILNKHQQASFAGAYALLDTSYKKYKNKVKELYGEGTDDNIIEEMAKDEYEEEPPSPEVPKGKALFFDSLTLQYFEADMDDVIQKVTMNDGLECFIIDIPIKDHPYYLLDRE